MRVIRSIDALKSISKRGSVVTIGVFDGVHIGHRAVIKKVVDSAKSKALKSVVLTFDPHPLKQLSPSAFVPNLISLEHRAELIRQMGVDSLIIIDFTKKISRLSPEQFVSGLLERRLNAKEVFVGENFYFGKDAKAGTSCLSRISKGYGIKVKVVKAVKRYNVTVSSSLIRKLIIKGDIRKAERLLGRPVSVLGTVVKGRSLARQLGFPTANINPHHEVVPPGGVYAVKVRLGGSLMNGVLNIGLRPTFYSSRDLEPTIEVHIFGFNKLIYGKYIEVLFVKKLRSERRFKGRSDLIRQIRLDARNAVRSLKKK